MVCYRQNNLLCSYGTSFLVIFTLTCSVLNNEFKDCIVNEWEPWSNCSKSCSVGESIRVRTIKQKSNWIFGKVCPSLEDRKKCGEENNGCPYICDEPLGICQCPNGYKLNNDQKTCHDVNECLPNNGLGPCSQKCENLNSTFKCSCHDGFTLASDNHDCVYQNHQELCSSYLHHIIDGTCVCFNGLSGLRCNRNKTHCENVVCKNKAICSSFVQASSKCVKLESQLSVLLRIPYSMYISGSYKYKVDLYLESLIDANLPKVKSIFDLNSNIQMKDFSDKFYVEGTTPVKIKGAYTYVRFIVFEYKENKYQEVEASVVCDKLSSSDVNCLSTEDCEILKSAGYQCPSYVYRPSFAAQKASSKKSFLWLYCSVIGLIVIGLVGCLFFVKHKITFKRNNKFHQNSNFLLASVHTARHGHNQNTDVLATDVAGFDRQVSKEVKYNSLYGENSDCLYESIDNLSTALKSDQIASEVTFKHKLLVDLDCNSDMIRYTDLPRKENQRF